MNHYHLSGQRWEKADTQLLAELMEHIWFQDKSYHGNWRLAIMDFSESSKVAWVGSASG